MRRTTRPDEPPSVDDVCLGQADRLASEGYLSQATRALKQFDPIAPTSDPCVYRQLIDLHPQAPQQLPALPSDAADQLLDEHDMPFFCETGPEGR